MVPGPSRGVLSGGQPGDLFEGAGRFVFCWSIYRILNERPSGSLEGTSLESLSDPFRGLSDLMFGSQ